MLYQPAHKEVTQAEREDPSPAGFPSPGCLRFGFYGVDYIQLNGFVNPFLHLGFLKDSCAVRKVLTNTEIDFNVTEILPAAPF
jgi:hypothetical protein